MLGFLTDELVWAAIREREDDARTTHPHTNGWPRTERSMALPNPLQWIGAALRRASGPTPQYH
jgi:hypothetical protein